MALLKYTFPILSSSKQSEVRSGNEQQERLQRILGHLPPSEVFIFPVYCCNHLSFLSVGAYGNRFVCVSVCLSVRALASTSFICEVKARYF